MKITKRFPNRICDHVYLRWIKDEGTVAVKLDYYFFPILDLRLYNFNSKYNKEEARHYVGIQICDYLKNIKTRSDILSDYWTNQYITRSELKKMLDVVESNVCEVLK